VNVLRNAEMLVEDMNVVVAAPLASAFSVLMPVATEEIVPAADAYESVVHLDPLASDLVVADRWHLVQDVFAQV
jgi:hypothetical protein